MSSTRKLNVISKKTNLEKFWLLEYNWHFAYSFFVIDGKIMVGIAGGSA